MRKLVIMRGPQGSGKSTILAKSGLARHTISLDAIRETVSGAVLNTHGEMVISQEHNPLCWRLAMESLTRRIATGETIAFDATMTIARDVENLINIGRAANYDIVLVDRSNCDRENAWAHNAQRPQHSRVPRSSFERTLAALDETRIIDPTVEVIDTGDDLEASIHAVRAFLRRGTEVRDLSSYERIVHIGDLQGCLTPLLDVNSPVANGLNDPSTFFIFHGDLFDRGIQNGEVATWWLENALGRDNVVLIAGNHEDHLEIEAKGHPPVSREFAARTLPQLRAAGLTREDIGMIAKSTVPILPYHWRGTTVLASHAGFPRWPDELHLVSDHQLRRGAGHYQTPVDEAWSRWSLEDGPHPIHMPIPTRSIWQVHGHRNQAMLPVIAAERSINLEGQVEFGGHLRMAVLDSSGWTPIEIRNRIHKTQQEFRLQDLKDGRKTYGHVAPLTPWAARGVTVAQPIEQHRFEAFRADPMVFESVSETRPHISAFNFSKQAFWGKHWTEITMHTRGLFVNTTSYRIAARSYPKFFNHGERRDTEDEALEANLVFPVSGFVKENGYLGITGYDDQSGELVVASKSRIDGEFAEWFKDILAEALGPAGMERLLRFNRDQVASCVFEVIDPVNDPHIIQEATRRVVLLDVIHRHEDFETMPYEDLVKLAGHFGCEVKRYAFRNIPNWQALSNILNRIKNDPSWRPNRRSGPVEGVVVEDSAMAGDRRASFMFKEKAHFYAFWKRARGAKERVALARRKQDATVDLARYEDDPALAAFVRWCMRQNDEVVSWDIVRLRDIYLADPEALVDGGLPPVPDPIPDQTGFLRGVDAIAAQVDAGTAKAETVRRLLLRAEEDEHRLAAFDHHPAASRLRSYAQAS